ncbi:MAG: cation:proton antiporter [Flavobacteriaceae bacterium]|nr:cation:proton antiporter [Flavobacteriaceae bacterium]
MEVKILITFLIGFLLVAIAANQIAKVFQKIKFPLITGLIITGIVAGSSVLNFITKEAVDNLNFLNDIALSIIAFSAGSELYLQELRSRMKSIKWMTMGQLLVPFLLGSVIVFALAEYIPFMQGLSVMVKIAISILFGTIFVARSPSSAIAVINEVRANGPFTKTILGVTVVTDVLVIILFSICFSLAKAFINGDDIGINFLIVLVLELIASFGLGILLGKLLQFPFNIKLDKTIKYGIVIALGYSVYLLAAYIKIKSLEYLHHEFLIEPLLICIIGAFVLTNYSKHRIEFSKIMEEISPTIYIIFFTITGASLSVQTLASVFGIALLLFLARGFTLFLGGVLGVYTARDDKKYTFIAWMPYLTQAGVAIGLTTIVANEFPEWGEKFETIIIAIIVLNQLVGPPFFKYAIEFVKESHLKATGRDTKNQAVIFGLENQSVSLAKQLISHKWDASIIATNSDSNITSSSVKIHILESFTMEDSQLKTIGIDKAEVAILMLSDEENFKIANTLYEKVGIKQIVVRLHDRENFDKFNDLGALVIDPTTAMVGLLDHFVRSPNAASLLLGLDKTQDTIDVEIANKDIHGLKLRELRLPSDVIILSVKRKGQLIISHGYTTLRIGDIITMVGNSDSLEELKTKFEF